MFEINFAWKQFNICVPEVVIAVTPLLTPKILGTSCDYDLTIHLESEPSQEEIDAVKSYWESLTDQSPEALNYKSASQIALEEKTNKDALLQSSRTKLLALGLTEAEISAILGV